MFSPGETVLHRFSIPFVAAELEKVVVSYKQGDDIVFEKTITSGFESLENNTKSRFSIAFSQEESLMFKELHNFTIQINVLTTFGTRATSKEIKGRNKAQYHKEVIEP